MTAVFAALALSACDNGTQKPAASAPAASASMPAAEASAPASIPAAASSAAASGTHAAAATVADWCPASTENYNASVNNIQYA